MHIITNFKTNILLNINILGFEKAIINILYFKTIFSICGNIVIFAKTTAKNNACVYYIIRI